ncbi:hypothetical protein CDEST_08450 [Colletotrichum destructivum]|uniref:Uncharacterized protein n=1 Tax=Colletotrichum destructivum TaxID=34406 RepID=A0AAX4IJ38_9PEZI|nr:hypothetical protein CDEST_08450 [Colletotrichum destructivum]
MEGKKRFEAASSRNTRGCAVVLYDPVAWVAWDKYPLFTRAPRPRPSKGLDGICTGRAPRKHQSKPACEKVEMISGGREVMKIDGSQPFAITHAVASTFHQKDRIASTTHGWRR